MKPELIAEGYIFLEAPRSDSKNNLYFTDNVAGTLLRRSPDGKIALLLSGRVGIGGTAVNADGRIVVSGFGGLILVDQASGKQEVLLDELNGEPIGAINDIQPDGDGGLYVGFADAAAKKAKSAEGVRRAIPQPLVLVSPDRRARRVAEGIKVSNGIGLSPDRRTLYQVETLEGVLAYDRDTDGSLSNCRLAIKQPLSDGISVDSEGCLWIALVQESSIVRYTPDGKLERRILIPVKEVTSLTFGGDDLRDIYVVTGSAAHQPGYLHTGRIYRLRSDVAGQASPVTRF